MSIPRKRGKVKKKSRTAKKVAKKAKKAVALRARQTRAKKKKRPVSVSVNTKKRKKRVSVNTKPSRRQTRPKPKPQKKRPAPKSPKKKRKVKRKKKKVRLTDRQQFFKAAVASPTAVLAAFLTMPEVASQMRDRIIEKGLAELTRGMVRTTESQILLSLIAAEQIGDFDQTAKELAALHNWSLKEIYDLWHSPETALS